MEWVFLIPLTALMIPIVAIVTAHRRKMAEIQMGSAGSGAAAEELRKMREQLAALRDSTTQFDLSFDTALQRMESRVANVEQRLSHVEGSQTTRA